MPDIRLNLQPNYIAPDEFIADVFIPAALGDLVVTLYIRKDLQAFRHTLSLQTRDSVIPLDTRYGDVLQDLIYLVKDARKAGKLAEQKGGRVLDYLDILINMTMFRKDSLILLVNGDLWDTKNRTVQDMPGLIENYAAFLR